MSSTIRAREYRSRLDLDDSRTPLYCNTWPRLWLLELAAPPDGDPRPDGVLDRRRVRAAAAECRAELKSQRGSRPGTALRALLSRAGVG